MRFGPPWFAVMQGTQVLERAVVVESSDLSPSFRPTLIPVREVLDNGSHCLKTAEKRLSNPDGRPLDHLC